MQYLMECLLLAFHISLVTNETNHYHMSVCCCNYFLGCCALLLLSLLLHTFLHNLTDTCKGSTVLSKIMTLEDCHLPARVECAWVCPSYVSPVQLRAESHQSEGFQLWPLLVLSSKVPQSFLAASPSHLTGQPAWGQRVFRDCQRAEPNCINSHRSLVQTGDDQRSPAKSSRLSSVCCLWSCVRDSLFSGLCAT